MTLAPARPATASAVRFATRLAEHGGAPALLAPEGDLTYAALAARVADAAAALGPVRRLVLVAVRTGTDAVVTYLAALAGGHPVLLTDDRPEHVAAMVEAYDPDVVAADGPGGWAVTERRPGTAHDLHPDLALLLSTSGSTGSPKLVRLSGEAVQANAEAIVDALGIRPDDVAMTSLPLHYCYGLSVLHSHLHRGAALVLTDTSVVDPCFWALVRARGATTLAGVPHTFDLLDRVGFADLDVPTLRCVTQAGGRMAPEQVRRYAALGRERGWDLHVMYGQTEATARMATLPPALATEHPASIGVAVPGGALRLDGVGDDGVGELVYSGPNVMLGYAHGPADLARGREVAELRTGDLARRCGEGLFEVVGRRSRFAKVVGLRIDLAQVERDLEDLGIPAHCADTGGGVVVATAQPCDAGALAADLAARYAVPRGAVTVLPLTEVPRLASGKPDYVALARLAPSPRPEPAVAGDEPGAAGPVPTPASADTVVRLYRELLDAPHAGPRHSFVDLGGDSLSYVEVSLRLEQLLGSLPPDWHLRSAAALVAETPAAPDGEAGGLGRWRPWGRWRTVETGIVLRAVAVLLILANHTHLADVPGGAHTLLVAAGWNFARFQLTPRERSSRVRGILRSAARVLVPSAVWIGGLALVSEGYSWHNPLMLQQVLGDHAQWSDQWHFWFIEVLLYFLVALAGLLAVPAIDRAERRWPFGLALAVVGAGLLTRYAVVVPDAGPYRGATAYVLVWLFALGWAAQKAGRAWQRVLVSALVVATVPGFWEDMPGREATIIGGALLLLWLPGVRLPRWLGLVAGTVASASLYIYLTHFMVYPHLMAYSSPLAIAACVAFGVAYWKAVLRAGQAAAPVRASASALAGRLRRRDAATDRPQRKADWPVSA